LAENLSGWEKRRLYLLSVLIKNPNFLILDEPTNDLDLLTLGILEDFLLQYQWCLLIISHDRFFMDKIVDHLLVFEGEWQIENFWGTYSEHKKKSKNKIQQKKKEKQTQKAEELPENTEVKKKKLSYHEKREFEQIELDLEKYEKRKTQINKLFDDKNIPYDDVKKLSQELWDVMANIERLETRWMELSEWI
jgi:ATP-binding cassette subfamily F protein uup